MTTHSTRQSEVSTPLGTSPAFALAASFSLFLLLKENAGIPFAVSAIVSLIATAGWFLMGTAYTAKSSLPAACAVLFVSVAGIVLINAGVSHRANHPRSIESSGVVLQDRRMGLTRAALVSVRSPGFLARPAKYVLKHDGELRPGDIVRFSGDAEEFERADGPREFDEFLYWKSRGAVASVRARSVETAGREFGLSHIRYALAERIKRFLPRRTAGYIAAAWLGERDRELRDFHSNAGTSHILAVSGLHIGAAAAIFWFFLRRVRFRLYILSAIIWSYALLSGASPSSVRAALMLQFVFAGRLLGQSGGPFNGVCFAAAVMLLYNPWIFWDVGWRMSVLSVMALTSLYSLGVGDCAKLLAASPVMWLVTSVQAAWTFGAVPLSGIVINFFAVPFFGFLLPFASLLSVPAVFGLRLGGYTALPAEMFFALWERFSNNVTYLVPWKADFSYPLCAAGVLVMAYIFARACGFPRSRAYCAVGVAAVYLIYMVTSGVF